MGLIEELGLESAIDFNTDPVATGIAPLDHALGGGVGRGRFAEFYGKYSSGKTLVLLMLMAMNSRAGGLGLFGDSEGSFDWNFYESLGGDPEKIKMIPPKIACCVEEMFDFVDAVADKAKKDPEWKDKPILIGWDGIANAATKHLLKEGMEKRDMSKAFAMSQGMQLITNKIRDTRIAFVATNQTREAIGTYDSATHTPGGESYKFGCSQRVEFMYDGGTKGSLITVGDENLEVGRRVVAYVRKNKMASPFGKCKLFCYTAEGFPHPTYDRLTKIGIDLDETLLDYYLNGRFYLDKQKFTRAVTASGGWYQIHQEFAPNSSKFREKDWPEQLEKFPVLKNVLYEDLDIDPLTYQPINRQAAGEEEKPKRGRKKKDAVEE